MSRTFKKWNDDTEYIKVPIEIVSLGFNVLILLSIIFKLTPRNKN